MARISYLSRRELCAKLGGCSFTTVWRLEKAGALPPRVMIGNRPYWVDHEVDELIANTNGHRFSSRSDQERPALDDDPNEDAVASFSERQAARRAKSQRNRPTPPAAA